MPKWTDSLKAAIGNTVLTIFVKVGMRPKQIFQNKNRKNCNYGEPVIFVGNHASHYDGIMTSVEFKKSKADIIVAKDWFEKKSINWYLKNARCIPMDRYGVDTGWLRNSKEAVKKGESIIIFPEGKTSKDGNIGEFKSGFVMLSIMTGARIVPFVIDGKYKMVFGRRQRIYLGEPLALTEEGKSLTPKYMEKESERFRQIIQDMKEKVK